jgi:hypothetical protein
MSDGTKIPVDWLNTFFAQSSEKLEEFMWGEGANTPGEHVGFSEYGLEFETEKIILSFRNRIRLPITGVIPIERQNPHFKF